ncbi:MAG: hypothetical protein ACMUEM_06910 [Flavobacteriales bacterium AspAUS03]
MRIKALKDLIRAFSKPLALISVNFESETTVDGLVSFDRTCTRFKETVDFIVEDVANTQRKITRSSTIIQINGNIIHILR